MFWVLLFVGIALAGLVMLVSYAVWLAHKLSDLFSELTMVGERTGELADLLAQVEFPGPGGAEYRDPDAQEPHSADAPDLRVADVR